MPSTSWLPDSFTYSCYSCCTDLPSTSLQDGRARERSHPLHSSCNSVCDPADSDWVICDDQIGPVYPTVTRRTDTLLEQYSREIGGKVEKMASAGEGA